MTLSLALAALWAILANVIAMIPSPKRRHWPAAWVLIAVGLPLLVFVFYENGVIVGLLVLAAGASVLRWPVRFLIRWIKRQVRGERAS